MTRRAAALGAALALASAASARAHIGHEVLRAERYLKLDATASDTRLVVSLTLGDLEGERVLRIADTDADGTLSDAEADAYLAAWGAGLRDELPVRVDGAPLEVEWRDGWLEPRGAIRRAPLSVEMVAHLALEGDEHVIVFEDRMRREPYERTDVSFRAHDGAELTACGAQSEPASIERDLAFGPDPSAPRFFGARVRFARAPRADTALWIGLGALACALVVTATLVLRRRARR